VARAIVDLLERRGAVFFSDIGAHVGGFGGELLDVLWELVWAGIVTNDTMAPLRSRLAFVEPSRRPRGRFERRRVATPGSEGRWSLLPREPSVSETDRAAALATVLLDRYGILMREAVLSEGVAGGYGAVYPVLKAMEEAGRARRGYFVAGLGAMQFARLGADDRLRALRESGPNSDASLILAATDPANPYGATLPWPEPDEDRETRAEGRPQRAAGAHVVIHDGRLTGFLGRGDKALLTFLSRDESTHTTDAEALATALAASVEVGSRKALVIARIDGADATRSELARLLVDRGFTPSGTGLFKRRAGSYVRI
jgi:ATP-dependent Lhr-like helicase